MAFGLSAGTIISGAVAAYGAVNAADAADGAASAGQAGAAKAAGLSAAQYAKTEARLSPYSSNGAGASNKLAYYLGTAGSPGTSSSLSSAARAIKQAFPSWAGNSDEEIVQGFLREAPKLVGDPNYAQSQGWNYGAPEYAKLSGLIPQAQQAAQGGTAENPDDFGSLLKKYTGEDLASDPGYAFRQSEGQKGVERSAASKGGLFSGQAGKALTRYNQDFASNEFNQAFNRDASSKNQIYSMLSGQAGQGLQAEGILANAGSGAAQAQGEYATQGANAEASGIVGGANAINNGISSFQNYNLLNSIYNKQAGSGASSAYAANPYTNFMGDYNSLGYNP